MAVESEDPVGTGDTVCQRCGQVYFRASGCQNCRETAKAASKISRPAASPAPSKPQRRKTMRWTLAFPRGTHWYASPEDAANRRNPQGFLPRQKRDWISSQRTWNGFISKVLNPDPFRKIGWVPESPEVGVFKRKYVEDADAIMEQNR